MRYVSTRGHGGDLGFTEVLLAGLAPDGGLYVPDHWPDLAAVSGSAPYAAAAASIMEPFVSDDFAADEFAALCTDAYSSFSHGDVAPLVQIDDDQWLLELFHGPTLAFKDIALQLVGRLFDRVLGRSGERITIVGATSGDTGSAAIDGVRGCEHVDIVILYPAGRTSEVQRRQMTTVTEANVHAVAIDGTFDDCQDLVKAMFVDAAFRDRLALSAVNSINWARVMAQIVYYVTASQSLGGPVTFSVPTGNFGNVLAGWIARRMGAAIDGFIVASNTNDILHRFISTGRMATEAVVETLSPSMDIQVSSNFERLLFEMNDRDAERTAAELVQFRSTGVLEVDRGRFDAWIAPVFSSAAIDDAATLAEISRVRRDCAVAIDPHTATGVAAARTVAADGPIITLATAHPAKFPDAVERATGQRPVLPEHLADLYERRERIVELPADLAAVQAYIERVSRVTSGG